MLTALSACSQDQGSGVYDFASGTLAAQIMISKKCIMKRATVGRNSKTRQSNSYRCWYS